LFISAFAVGFPVVYRWPFQDEEFRYPLGNDGRPDLTKPPNAKIVTTWRRTWGGGSEKHGRRVTQNLNSSMLTVEHYERDLRHGAFTAYIDNEIVANGRYFAGQRDGTWVFRAPGIDGQTTIQWHKGRVHGLWESNWPVTKVHERLHFCMGRLTLFFDKPYFFEKPYESRLLSQLARDEIGDPRIVQALGRLSPVETAIDQSKEMSLEQFCAKFRLQNGPELTIEPSLGIYTVSACPRYGGIDVASDLIMSLRDAWLDCEYRDGCLWIIPMASDVLNAHWLEVR
jgi:hypothetical protein